MDSRFITATLYYETVRIVNEIFVHCGNLFGDTGKWEKDVEGPGPGKI